MKNRILLFTILITSQIFAQETKYPQTDFVAPVNIPMYLSGTFGEMRGNHFHSGIDIKTNGSEGIPIIAIADGYVSRIKVSPGGFGKALYIKHPNGYSSVYAHLQRFSDDIQQYVTKNQYKEESFAVNLFPKAKVFQVKQGDTIAVSGNTGSSLGPHLHFEIRESETETPVNPLFFNFAVRDYVRPRISALKIYPYDHMSQVDGKNEALKLAVAGWGEKHRLEKEKLHAVSGNIYFGIDVDDQLNDMPNRNGVYSVELFVDSTLVYSTEMEKFSFYETRYINSLIDYAEYTSTKSHFQKTFVEPNNELSIYRRVENDGIVSFSDSSMHQIEYVIKDLYGNVSKLHFELKSLPPDSSRISYELEEGMLFNHVIQNEFVSGDFKLKADPRSFYNSFFFKYDIMNTLKPIDKLYSKIHSIHDESIAIHKWIDISIRVDSIPEGSEDKLLVVKLSDDLEFEAAGGTFKEGWMHTGIRDFGNYAVVLDTVPPKIEALNIYENKNIKNMQAIRIKITDELSGISGYKPTLNGKWILMEYDPKNDLLLYSPDNMLKKGKNTFKLEVWDERGNRSERKLTLFNK